MSSAAIFVWRFRVYPFFEHNGNSADPVPTPVPTPSNAASDQGLHCLLIGISMQNTCAVKVKTLPEKPLTTNWTIQMTRKDKSNGQKGLRDKIMIRLYNPTLWDCAPYKTETTAAPIRHFPKRPVALFVGKLENFQANSLAPNLHFFARHLYPCVNKYPYLHAQCEYKFKFSPKFYQKKQLEWPSVCFPGRCSPSEKGPLLK